MLYSLLRTEDLSDGSSTEALAKSLKKQPGCQIQPELLCNVFDRLADAAFGVLGRYFGLRFGRQERKPFISAVQGHRSTVFFKSERPPNAPALSKRKMAWPPGSSGCRYTEGALVE